MHRRGPEVPQANERRHGGDDTADQEPLVQANDHQSLDAKLANPLVESPCTGGTHTTNGLEHDGKKTSVPLRDLFVTSNGKHERKHEWCEPELEQLIAKREDELEVLWHAFDTEARAMEEECQNRSSQLASGGEHGVHSVVESLAAAWGESS